MSSACTMFGKTVENCRSTCSDIHGISGLIGVARYLVLEYVEGGELFDYVQNHAPLPEEEAVRLFRQIIAGLGFCHRFNICHRDLKPENILLDGWHNVKIADFGMAALQPAGHWLNTSCGSPHYAAPEIIHGRRYRGDRADIWSCGIILYALLTGYLPFDGGDLANTLRMVKRGDYTIPHELSAESADLIQRILQKKPEERISMQDMFMHPLLRKYERLHQAMSGHHVGPPPPLSVHECGSPISSIPEIDVDILRNLQTLWHDVKPDALVNRLLCLEPTQERMFYNALVKFRDEQTENYQGQPLEYSASDYHHISRPLGRASSKRGQMSRGNNGSLRSQRRTQFTVMTPPSRRTGSVKEPKSTATARSYDPYRSPQNVKAPEPNYAQITVHREPSVVSDDQTPVRELERPSNPAPSSDYGDDEDFPPSSPFAVVRNKKTKGTSIKSFHSRVSQASSRRGTVNAHTPRAVSHKRNVSFHHIRQRSHGSTPVSKKNASARDTAGRRQTSQSSLLPSSLPGTADRHGSPALPAQPTVVRSAGASLRHRPQVKKVRDTEFIWKDEARQVSHELSKICEEAFNGSSMSTGCTTSVCGGTESPATSMTMATPETSQSQIMNTMPKGRSLPETPGSSPACSAADLAETRRKLIEHAKQEGSNAVPPYISGVITQLDRLIEQDNTARQSENYELHDNRVPGLADSFVKLPGEPSYLPSITEELNNAPFGTSTKDALAANEQKNIKRSAVGSQASTKTTDSEATVRMVPYESLRSIAEVKPLTIRKKGKMSKDESQDRVGNNGSFCKERSTRYDSAPSKHNRNASGLDPIEEHPKQQNRNDGKGSYNKKWSWFRHRSHGSRDNISNAAREPRPIQPSTATVVVHDVKRPEEEQHGNQESTSRKSSAESHIGGFLKKLIKRKPSKTEVNEQPTGKGLFFCKVFSRDGCSNTVTDTEEQVTVNTMAEPEPEPDSDTPTTPIVTNDEKPLPRRPRYGNRSNNWFARVFQIKPATRVIALSTSKVRGRKEVYRILREWKQYGLEDVSMDKTNSTIHGRVGENNFLRLRPVEFSAEFYTVLEHGRQANLSLIRFRQDRGAASSFGKVVDSLSVVMKQRDLLVEDPARAKKMARVLDDYPN